MNTEGLLYLSSHVENFLTSSILRQQIMTRVVFTQIVKLADYRNRKYKGGTNKHFSNRQGKARYCYIKYILFSYSSKILFDTIFSPLHSSTCPKNTSWPTCKLSWLMFAPIDQLIWVCSPKPTEFNPWHKFTSELLFFSQQLLMNSLFYCFDSSSG